MVKISRPTIFPLKPRQSCGGSIFLESLTFPERNPARKFVFVKKKCINNAVYIYCHRIYSFLTLYIGVICLILKKYTLETQQIIKKIKQMYSLVDRLCGLVVRVSGYRYRGPGFEPRRYQLFWVVVGLERGPLSLVSLMRSIEELLECKK